MLYIQSIDIYDTNLLIYFQSDEHFIQKMWFDANFHHNPHPSTPRLHHFFRKQQDFPSKTALKQSLYTSKNKGKGAKM